jgi:hypothetical protein
MRIPNSLRLLLLPGSLFGEPGSDKGSYPVSADELPIRIGGSRCRIAQAGRSPLRTRPGRYVNLVAHCVDYLKTRLVIQSKGSIT